MTEAETITHAISANNPAPLLEIITRKSQLVGPDGFTVAERLDAHSLALHRVPFAHYVNNGATPEAKIAFLRVCLRAALKVELKNKPAVYQTAYADLQGTPVKPMTRDQLAAERALGTPQGAPKPQPAEPETVESDPVDPETVAPVNRAAHLSDHSSAAASMVEAILQIASQATSAPSMTAEQVNALVQSAVESRLQAAIELMKQSAPPRASIDIVTPEGTRTIEGALHGQATQIATWLQACPVWTWGSAGGGKTTMAYQIAEMLGVKACVVPIDETITVGKLMGYRNLQSGEYVPGLLYEAYKSGGLLVLDEIDTNSCAIASANALLANDQYMFPNGETVARHPKCYRLALGNTKGTGAVAGYTARVRLDAATLDRFAILELKYDEGLEMQLACGIQSQTPIWQPGDPSTPEHVERFCRWIQSVRRHAGTSVLVSPRAVMNSAKALRSGIPPVEVADALVFKLTTDDTRARLVSMAGSIPLS